MILIFLPEAQAELHAAEAHYQAMETGLERRFVDEIAEVSASILDHPRLWREHATGYRRVNCPVFPYYLAYFIRGESVLIATVAHSARHPDYWKTRMID